MKNTPPSAQTELNNDVAYYILPHGMDRAYGEKEGIIYVAMQIRLEDIIYSERTRLLSVESMKMEKVNLNDPDWLKYGKERSNIVRRDLRQSILSEMEKGSV